MQFQQSLKNSKIGFLFLVLVIICSLTLVGCGKKEKKQASKTVKQELSGKGVKREKLIKIGAILPLTGPIAVFGDWLKEGISLAANDFKNVQIIFEDTQDKTREAISAYRKLTEVNHVRGIISARTPVALSLAPMAEKDHMPTLLLFSDIPKNSHFKYVLNFHFPGREESTLLAKFAIKNIGNKGALLIVNDDFGKICENTFTQIFTSEGGQVVFKENIKPGSTNFKNILYKLKQLKPSFIFIVLYQDSLVNFLKQKAELNIKIPIVSPNCFIVFLNLIKHMPFTAFVTLTKFDIRKNRHFINLSNKYHIVPNLAVAEAYEGTKFFLKTLLSNPNFIRTGWKNIEIYHSELFGKIVFKHAQAQFPLFIGMIRDGKIIKIYK